MNEDEYFTHLLDIGVIVLAGIDRDDDPVYTITPEAQALAPEFYDQWIAKQNAIVTSLWNKDMLDLSFAEDDVYISLTDNSFKTEYLDQLDEMELEVLGEIINDFADRLEFIDMERSEES